MKILLAGHAPLLPTTAMTQCVIGAANKALGTGGYIADNAAGTPVAADEFLYNSVACPRIRIIVEIEILGTV